MRPTAGRSGSTGRGVRLRALVPDVRPGEGRTALALFGAVFLVMCAYYLVKPLREGWIAISAVAGLSRLEIRAYSSLAQAVLLAAAVAGYARVAARWPRHVLVTRTSLACVATLVVFWLLQPGVVVAAVPGAGIAFYLWVGMFGVFIVAQLWAFATDLYADERGRRLLPLIAIGGTAGAAAGSALHGLLAAAGPAGARAALLVAVLPLALSVVLVRAADGADAARERPRPARAADRGRARGRGAGHGFVLAAGMLALLFSWATTNGENLLFHVVQEAVARDAAAAGLGAAAARVHTQAATNAFYGDLYLWTNLAALAAQALAASRLLRHRGLAVTLLALPVLALLASAALVLAPALAIVKWMKVAERATDYSLNQTARHALWLPVAADVKYESKPTVDGVFVRAGDGFAALTVLAGGALGGVSTAALVGMNAGLVVLWVITALVLIREHRRLLALAAAMPATLRRLARRGRALGRAAARGRTPAAPAERVTPLRDRLTPGCWRPPRLAGLAG